MCADQVAFGLKMWVFLYKKKVNLVCLITIVIFGYCCKNIADSIKSIKYVFFINTDVKKPYIHIYIL